MKVSLVTIILAAMLGLTTTATATATTAQTVEAKLNDCSREGDDNDVCVAGGRGGCDIGIFEGCGGFGGHVTEDLDEDTVEFSGGGGERLHDPSEGEFVGGGGGHTTCEDVSTPDANCESVGGGGRHMK